MKDRIIIYQPEFPEGGTPEPEPNKCTGCFELTDQELTDGLCPECIAIIKESQFENMADIFRPEPQKITDNPLSKFVDKLNKSF